MAGQTQREWAAASKAHRQHYLSLVDELQAAGKTFASAEDARKTRTDGFVYVISHPRLPGVKVGKAFDADRRLATYQTGCPERAYRLEYVSDYCEDAQAVESLAMNGLADARLEGEWFDITPAAARLKIKAAWKKQHQGASELHPNDVKGLNHEC
jgi:hypothetical protein